MTTHTTLSHVPIYCKFRNDLEFHPIQKFVLELYGIKEEAPLQKIPVKQSDSDRRPIDYEPVEISFVPNQPSKITKMRLHFANTTGNNNRKRNRPNPDQRYFLLVVEIQIITKNKNIFTMCSSVSERVIVRVCQFRHILIEETYFILL